MNRIEKFSDFHWESFDVSKWKVKNSNRTASNGRKFSIEKNEERRKQISKNFHRFSTQRIDSARELLQLFQISNYFRRWETSRSDFRRKFHSKHNFSNDVRSARNEFSARSNSAATNFLRTNSDRNRFLSFSHHKQRVDRKSSEIKKILGNFSNRTLDIFTQRLFAEKLRSLMILSEENRKNWRSTVLRRFFICSSYSNIQIGRNVNARLYSTRKVRSNL